MTILYMIYMNFVSFISYIYLIYDIYQFYVQMPLRNMHLLNIDFTPPLLKNVKKTAGLVKRYIPNTMTRKNNSFMMIFTYERWMAVSYVTMMIRRLEEVRWCHKPAYHYEEDMKNQVKHYNRALRVGENVMDDKNHFNDT